MKKLISLVAVAVLSVSLFSGCGGKKEPAPAAQTPPANTPQVVEEKKPVTMQLAIWGNDAHKKMYEELLTKYKEENPHVTSEVLIIPFAEYQQKLSIMKAGGQAPDIAWLSDLLIAQFLETNQLMDITKLTTDKDYDFADISTTLLDPVKKDGKIYGIPFSVPPLLMYYNKTMFKEKGLKTPIELYKENKWNFDEYLKAAKALTNKDNGIYGARVTNDWKGWYYNVVDFVWGFGGDVFGPDGKKFLLNSPEAEKGVQFFIDMIYKYEVHPKPGDQSTFDSGKNAMWFSTLAYMNTAKKITDFEWDIAPLPEGPKNSFTRTGFAAYVMFKLDNDSKVDEKLALFKHLTSKESMSVTAQYFVPPRKSVISSEAFLKLYPDNIRESLKITIIDRMGTVRVPYAPQNFAKVNSEVQLFFDMLYTNNMTVKDALKQMEEKVAPLFK